MRELEEVDFFDLEVGDIANLLLQRTSYMERNDDGRPEAFLDWMRRDDRRLLAEAADRRELVLNLYRNEIQNELDQLREYLPARATAVADIGAGIGLLDLAIHRALDADLHLIDIETTPERYHLYADKGAGYANLATARAMLLRNGVPEGRLRTTNPRREQLEDGTYDVIVSLLAMGFHFPCDTYHAFIKASLAPGGVCIFDHRKGSDQDAFLAIFDRVDVILDLPRSRRLVCRMSHGGG